MISDKVIRHLTFFLRNALYIVKNNIYMYTCQKCLFWITQRYKTQITFKKTTLIKSHYECMET